MENEEFFEELVKFSDENGYYMSIGKNGGKYLSVYISNENNKKIAQTNKYGTYYLGSEYLEHDDYIKLYDDGVTASKEDILSKIKDWLTTELKVKCGEYCQHCGCESEHYKNCEPKVPVKCSNCGKYIMLCSMCEAQDNCELCTKICKKLNGE